MRFHLRLIAAVAAAGSVVVGGLPAQAGTIVIDDRDRDGQHGPSLDFTSVEVANRTHAVVITARFRRVTAGDLAAYVLPVGAARDEQVRLVSSLRARRVRSSIATQEGVQRCDGLVVTWDREEDTFRARVPARCINGGDYGAVRVRLITEIGSDADLSPGGPRGGWPWSRPVSRG